MARLGRSQPFPPLLATFTATRSVALSGTVTTATEADIVAGGKTVILTLSNCVWVASGGTFDGQRQNIINGMVSAQSELLGWNNVVQALQGVAGVVRTSDTVVTITLDAQITYSITANETITVTVPGTALDSGGALVATPTFTITEGAGVAVPDLSWKGWYPDQLLWKPSLSPHLQAAWVGPVQPEHVIALDARAFFPDSIDRLTVHPSRLPFVARSLQPEHVIARDAQAFFPDRIDRQTVLAALQPFLARSLQPEHQIASDARAFFPDRIDRQTVPAAQQPFFTTSLQPEQTLPQALAVYPDRIDRRVLPVAAIPFATEALSPAFPVPHLSWHPEYPDRVRRDALLAAWQQALAFWPFPIAQPEAPSLSWQGRYPDQIWRQVFHAAFQQAMAELTTPPQVQLTWAPVVQIHNAPQDAAVPSGMTPRSGGS